MKNELIRIGEPYLFEFKNESGTSCHIDASPKIGGTNKGFRPMELLTGALAGCVAIDVINILKKQRINPESFKINIDAKREDGVPSPFEWILLTVQVSDEVNKEKLEKNVKLVIEKYCSVAASLAEKVEIKYEIETL